MRPRPPARPGIPHHTHHPLRRLVRAASWHRRKLAVVAAALTVVTGLAATAPPAPPTSTVVRARSDLAGGTVLGVDDLEAVDLPREGLPERATADLDALVGQRLAAPVTRHQVLTPLAVTSAEVVGVGHVLAPVRLGDADVVALLRPGDVVDVIGVAAEGGRTSTVAHAVRVVTIPARSADDQATTAGALVVLDVPDTATAALAGAAASGALTVIWR
ncbi:SAF domain-containing protein [Microlunatus flavus]|uniref:Flp pilus assembly protein CpaB n=1 Tax=Microlunatus flavus TaxID=1036181 RepID=A0A1H9JZB6_9ACTN|nr:SAF domain-containing protein [Microlunatus flavus]SEQ92179.1 Flp pilus assembly protein CpaB [Microlunatus flavus]